MVKRERTKGVIILREGETTQKSKEKGQKDNLWHNLQLVEGGQYFVEVEISFR